MWFLHSTCVPWIRVTAFRIYTSCFLGLDLRTHLQEDWASRLPQVTSQDHRKLPPYNQLNPGSKGQGNKGLQKCTWKMRSGPDLGIQTAWRQEWKEKALRRQFKKSHHHSQVECRASHCCWVQRVAEKTGYSVLQPLREWQVAKHLFIESLTPCPHTQHSVLSSPSEPPLNVSLRPFHLQACYWHHHLSSRQVWESYRFPSFLINWFSQQEPDVSFRNRAEPSSDFPSITPPKEPRFLQQPCRPVPHLPAPPARCCPCHPWNKQAGAPTQTSPAIISVSNTLSPEAGTDFLPPTPQVSAQTADQPPDNLLSPSTFPSLLTLHPSTLPLIFFLQST